MRVLTTRRCALTPPAGRCLPPIQTRPLGLYRPPDNIGPTLLVSDTAGGTAHSLASSTAPVGARYRLERFNLDG